MSAIDSMDIEKLKLSLGDNVNVIPVHYLGKRIKLEFIRNEHSNVVFELEGFGKTVWISHKTVGFPDVDDLLMCFDAIVAFIEECPAFRLISVTGGKTYNVTYDRFLLNALSKRKKRVEKEGFHG